MKDGRAVVAAAAEVAVVPELKKSSMKYDGMSWKPENSGMGWASLGSGKGRERSYLLNPSGRPRGVPLASPEAKPSKVRISEMMVGWIWSDGTGAQPFVPANMSYGGVATVDGVFRVFDGELAEEDGDGTEEHGVPTDPGDMRCVLPPRRSSSVAAGFVLSADSALLNASCACRRNFCTTSCSKQMVRTVRYQQVFSSYHIVFCRLRLASNLLKEFTQPI